MTGKRPAYQWYPGDFRRDTAVQACSFEARALWREMLDLMHDGEPYGHLTAGGVLISVAELCRIVGAPLGKVRKWYAELEQRKVFSLTATGVPFSRRMLKDEQLRDARAKAGSAGGLAAHGFAQDLLKQTAEQIDSKTPPLSTATAFAVAVDQVVEAARDLAIAANQGLADHASRPQRIPRIMAGSGKTHEAAERILMAGVPLTFAKSAVYTLAKSHNADGEVKSLNYLAGAVFRLWQEEGERAATSASRPATIATTRNGTLSVDQQLAALEEWGKKSA